MKKKHNSRINKHRTKKQEKEERTIKKQHNERLIKHGIRRDIRILFEQEEKDYYESKRVNNFWNNNDREYVSNGHKNKNLSLEEYLNRIETYLRNIIIFKILIHGKFT